MSFNLGVIGGFVVLRVQPPHGGAGEGDRCERNQNPARDPLTRGFLFRVARLTGLSRPHRIIHVNDFRFNRSCHDYLPPSSSWSFASAPPMAREKEIMATSQENKLSM